MQVFFRQMDVQLCSHRITRTIKADKTRAPPPEARRAEERGRTPRRTPPIFTPRATPEAEASERPASEFHPQPRQRRGRAAPAKAAHRRVSGGAVAASGAAIPERRPRAARVQRRGAQRRG